MSLAQRARESGRCAPSLLLAAEPAGGAPAAADADGFEAGLLRALDATGLRLRPESQAAEDFLPLLQKAESLESLSTVTDDELKRRILVHRRCLLLAVLGGADPSSASVTAVLDGGYLSSVKKWLEDILGGAIGGMDLLLHLLTCIATLPVTKAVVKSSGMGKIIGSLEKNSMCTGSPNAAAIKERIQSVKDNWNASVKALKSQDQVKAAPPDDDVSAPQETVAEAKASPKRPPEADRSTEAPPKRAKLSNDAKKTSSFSSLLNKVSGSKKVWTEPSSDQESSTKSNGSVAAQPKKVLKRVKWSDHFGGNLLIAQTVESDDPADGAAAAAASGAPGSWADRKKRDRLHEKELLAKVKKAKLMDDDEANDSAERSICKLQPTRAWQMPSLLPDMPDVTKPELLSNEKSLQDDRMRSIPAVRYANEHDVPSAPSPLSDVEQALDMTSQTSAVLGSIPFFVPEEVTSAPVSSSVYTDSASTTEAAALLSHQPIQSVYGAPVSSLGHAGATPEFLQSLGLPLFLVGQDTQALQTIAASPGLLGTLVDATGQYDQQRMISLVQTISSSSGQPTQTSAYGMSSSIYGQTPAAPSAYGAPAGAGLRAKSDAGNLHISNFGPTTTQNDIIQLFSPYVRVDEVFMKGSFAFVNTSDPVNAQIAREALSGTLLNGMPVRINPATRKTPRENAAYGPTSVAPAAVGSAQVNTPVVPQMPGPPMQPTFAVSNAAPVQSVDTYTDDRGNPSTKNLFVAGYGHSTTEQQLRDMFSQQAEVIGVVSKGAFSFVNTASREQAVACRQIFHGTMLNGGALRINFAKETGRLGTSFDLTYGKDTGPNSRRGPVPGPGAAPIPYGAPPAPSTYGAQPRYGGTPNYYGPSA